MSEIYTKENDYTLLVTIAENSEIKQVEDVARIKKETNYSRIFNFASGQVTTLLQSRIYQSRNTDSGASAAVSTQMHIQNFTDLPSRIELDMMHAKLTDMGGKPPPLDDVLNGRHKRPLGLGQKITPVQ